MPYPDDQYKLKDKSNAELHEWIAGYKPGTAEHVAGIEESMRRVASIEELIERNEAPVRKRELKAVGIAILALVIVIIAILLSH